MPIPDSYSSDLSSLGLKAGARALIFKVQTFHIQEPIGGERGCEGGEQGSDGPSPLQVFQHNLKFTKHYIGGGGGGE